GSIIARITYHHGDNWIDDLELRFVFPVRHCLGPSSCVAKSLGETVGEKGIPDAGDFGVNDHDVSGGRMNFATVAQPPLLSIALESQVKCTAFAHRAKDSSDLCI